MMGWDGWDWPSVALVALCVVLALLPPKYDPAIRLKEWLTDK